MKTTLALSLLGSLAVTMILSGCSSEGPPEQGLRGRDPHSFSRPDEVAVSHLDLDIEVDPSQQRIRGKATLRLENRTGASRLFLDTRDLDIERVTSGEQEQEAPFSLGESVPFLGRPLIIELEPDTTVVQVHYATRPEAAALQWLEPEQTSGGKAPFLFTQSQAILARTWIPCQDSPGVRTTYAARVKVPPGLMAVMSAQNATEKAPDGIYEFSMPLPIPSYLLALAVGDLVFRSTGERSGVYAEPSVVEKAAWEFADTEKMIEAAEELYGPYRWERYDVLVLPPSFPFGGMENPRLTFATPTILAGDRSLVSLIAHELAHSWSGNLVTNATWNDFWLNEGFTTYFEHRIMRAVYGEEYERMLAVLSKNGLEGAVSRLGSDHPDSHLYLDLDGRDPDDGVTQIPYEKGHFFLRMLEENLGQERWDAFLLAYFDRFAFQSMTTEGFLSYFDRELIQGDEALKKKLGVDKWVYGPGLPENFPKVTSSSLEQVKAQTEAFLTGTSPEQLETSEWATPHWRYFLEGLPGSMSRAQMDQLDSAFKFSQSGNSEILSSWLQHVVEASYEPSYPAVERFLTVQGRRKFLTPLYSRLARTPEGLEMARRIYRKARPGYHSVSRGTIDELLQ